MYPSALVLPPGFDENLKCELQKCCEKKMSNNLVIKAWIIDNNNGIEEERREKKPGSEYFLKKNFFCIRINAETLTLLAHIASSLFLWT